jgi:hypothetical protein
MFLGAVNLSNKNCKGKCGSCFVFDALFLKPYGSRDVKQRYFYAVSSHNWRTVAMILPPPVRAVDLRCL